MLLEVIPLYNEGKLDDVAEELRLKHNLKSRRELSNKIKGYKNYVKKMLNKKIDG